MRKNRTGNDDGGCGCLLIIIFAVCLWSMCNRLEKLEQERQTSAVQQNITR